MYKQIYKNQYGMHRKNKTLCTPDDSCPVGGRSNLHHVMQAAYKTYVYERCYLCDPLTFMDRYPVEYIKQHMDYFKQEIRNTYQLSNSFKYSKAAQG